MAGRDLETGIVGHSSRSPNFVQLGERLQSLDLQLRERSTGYRTVRTGQGLAKPCSELWWLYQQARKVWDEESRTEGLLNLSKKGFKTVLQKAMPGASLHPAFALGTGYLDLATRLAVAIDRLEQFEQRLRAERDSYRDLSDKVDSLLKKKKTEYALSGELYKPNYRAAVSPCFQFAIYASAYRNLTGHSERQRWLRSNGEKVNAVALQYLWHRSLFHRCLKDLLETAFFLRVGIEGLEETQRKITSTIETGARKGNAFTKISASTEEIVEASEIEERTKRIHQQRKDVDALEDLARSWDGTYRELFLE